MSELIDNNKKRQENLKKLILDLHDGHDFDEVKEKFQEQFGSVSAKEISDMEQALIKDGMPVEKIQNLCDVHAAVFKGSIEEIHKPDNDETTPGHPIHTFLLENSAVENIIEAINKAMDNNESEDLLSLLKNLTDIDKHYTRKENIIFPLLEKHDIYGPPKVMWAIDDEVRQELKQVIHELEQGNGIGETSEAIRKTIEKTKEMVFKENKILVPMALETFSQEEWAGIWASSDEIGFSFIEVENKWKPSAETTVKPESKASSGSVNLGAGALSEIELKRMLNTLPVDITFVDSNDKVKYFSEGAERIFPRPRTIIGREVRNCHPPASVHIVEKLVEDLKSGKKEHEDFWIKMGGKFVYIRYFAVRDDAGKYLGTLEFTQNITNIVELEGEKRLVED